MMTKLLIRSKTKFPALNHISFNVQESESDKNYTMLEWNKKAEIAKVIFFVRQNAVVEDIEDELASIVSLILKKDFEIVKEELRCAS